MTKICTKCGQEKELSEFYKQKTHKDGLSSWCKKCYSLYYSKNEKRLAYQKKYYSNPIVKERVKKYHKEWRKNNIETVLIKGKIYYQNTKIIRREKSKNYRQNHKEYFKEYNKQYYQNNLEKLKEQHEKYRQNNLEKIKEQAKKYEKNNCEKINERKRNRKKNDIHYKLRLNISNLIYMRLKFRLSNKNGKSTFSFLPYTVDDLIKRLESLFKPWMSWKNYGNKPGYWNIDHKYPDSLFDYKSVEDEEFQKCWALDNLQPMEYIENIKKSNKLIYE
jgi:hypothetical protein